MFGCRLVTPLVATGTDQITTHSTTTNFFIVALEPLTVPASRTVDAFDQFTVLHVTGDRKGGYSSNFCHKPEGCGPHLVMSTYVKTPGTTKHTQHSSKILVRGRDGTAGRGTEVPNVFNGNLGLAAVNIGRIKEGGETVSLVAVAWVQQLTFAPTHVVIVQVFSAPQGKRMGNRLVVTDFNLRDHDAPRRPVAFGIPLT